MTERERKARVFPQGWDWFWGLWTTVFATHAFVRGIWGIGILLIITGIIILGSRWFGRVTDAHMADMQDELHEAYEEFLKSLNELEASLPKEVQDGWNSGGRKKSSPKKPSKRP